MNLTSIILDDILIFNDEFILHEISSLLYSMYDEYDS